MSPTAIVRMSRSSQTDRGMVEIEWRTKTPWLGPNRLWAYFASRCSLLSTKNFTESVRQNVVRDTQALQIPVATRNGSASSASITQC